MTAGDRGCSIFQSACLACVLEATAPKPGNVHRGADFEDLTYLDLIKSASAIAPILQLAPQHRLGEVVLSAIRATADWAGTNSNLGIVLLLAPLAKANDNLTPAGVAVILDGLTPADAEDYYTAIRTAQAGGLGRVDRADVADNPTTSLLEAMRLAADRDLVARQYANRYEDVFQRVLPQLLGGLEQGYPLGQAIVWAHLNLMAAYPDSLIARKCGALIARQAADRAAEVLASGEPGEESFRRSLADFDFWLRSDGHRRNPGTSADLVTAALFIGLRTGQVSPTARFYPAC